MKKSLPFITSLFVFLGMISVQSAQDLVKGEIRIQDSLELDRMKYVNLIREQIKGKENLPADSVYKNLKIFNRMPAGRLLAVMNIGYSKSLGVSCGHCHNTSQWDSDEKKTKLIAREMAKMTQRINNELLKEITALKDPIVNCTTCHRGKTKPALNLE